MSEETLPEFNKQLELPDKYFKLGKHAVVITNKSEFIQRIKSSVQKNGYGIEAKLVDYYDPTEFSGHFGEQAVFKKRIKFQDQREYRFAIDTGIYGDDALRLEIGDIRDIAHSCDVTDVNKGLEIKLAK